MQAASEHRDRDDVQISVLDALVGREEGLTVFELRSHVDADIDRLESALADLKQDGLITADTDGDRTVITATAKAEPTSIEDEPSWLDSLLDRLPF